MSANEANLLRSLLASSTSYVEFGCGGSTVMASRLVSKQIISIDSSKDWLQRTEEACVALKPLTIEVDIGPLKEWGWPRDESRKENWIDYYEAVWSRLPTSREADTFLVDGRFRVACFLKTILEATRAPLIAIHDYERVAYHAVEAFAETIVRSEKLAVFRKKVGVDHVAVESTMRRYAYDAS